MADQRLNLVVIGATGVGKSTFLNYLLDREERKTSLSERSTGYGFWRIDAKIRDFPVILIDSWGLEAGKSKEWLQYLFNELKERENTLDIKDCFHAVTYVISATGNRVQDFDLNILRLLIDRGYSVIVVLTKAAKVGTEVIEAMRGVIAAELGEVPVVAVNSKDETLMDGHQVVKFGVEEFERQIVLRFWETIRRRIPRLIGQKLVLEVEENWDKKITNGYISNISKWELLDTNKTSSHIKSEADVLKRAILKKSIELRKSEVDKARRMYRALAECMDQTGSWELPEDNRQLEIPFEVSVSDPTFFEKISQVITLGLFDASLEPRRRFQKAAADFSKALKAQIEEKLVPQIESSIVTIRFDAKRLSGRKDTGRGIILRLIDDLIKRMFRGNPA